jgi:hypothetical protein
MPDATKYQTMDRFIGIDNVNDPTRLYPVVADRTYVYPLQSALNMEIDNTYGISSRAGYDDVLTGTDIHSLWSDNTTCLYVDGGTLYQMKTGYNTVALRTGLTLGARMTYAPVNDRIYYTNRHQIGYVKAEASILLTDPALEFKMPLPPGQFIEYYRGCLYVAADTILYISDPLCDYFDIRTGYKLFTSPITLLRAVDEGLYVGDDKIYWVQGKGADEFDRDLAYSYRAIPYTDVRVNGQNVGDGIKGNVAIWTCENGICIGDNAGAVVNITEARYTFTACGRGAGFVRENNNVRHYINTLY